MWTSDPQTSLKSGNDVRGAARSKPCIPGSGFTSGHQVRSESCINATRAAYRAFQMNSKAVSVKSKLENEVISRGICVGCGACVALAPRGEARMEKSSAGVIPSFDPECDLPELAWTSCPGKGNDYPELYERHFGSLPSDWRVGHIDRLWTGFSSDPVTMFSIWSISLTTCW